jgi:hypothetical protein
MKYPKVYIVLINYDGWADTIECLESILRNSYPNYHVVVIDNNSQDNSIEYIKAWAEGKLEVWIKPNNVLRFLSNPPIEKPISYVYYTNEEALKGSKPRLESESENNYPLTFIQTGDNLGFAGGNNVGIRYALAQNDFDYIWLLNNDTVIDKNSLSDIITAAAKDNLDRPIGSYVYEYHEPETLQLYGGLRFYKYSILRPSFAKLNGNIDCISGVSLFLSQEKINELGLMEEKYFLNSEDLEYTYFYKETFKKRHKDVSSFLVAGKLWHKKAASQNKDKFLHAYYFTRNILYTSLKINKINFLLTFVYAVLRCIFYFFVNKRDKAEGIFQGIKDFINKKKGKWNQHAGQ